MPRLLFARPPLDPKEEYQLRKLAGSRHAPGDGIIRAKRIVGSWEHKRTTTIAQELGCHPQTVRERLVRVGAEGLDGLGDRPGGGRKPRLTEQERGRIIALARSVPPGKLVRMGTSCALPGRRRRHSGAWLRSPAQRRSGASTLSAARSGASCAAKGCAGVQLTPFERVPIPTLSQKKCGRHPLRQPTRGRDDPLPGFARPGDPAYLSPGSWLVARRPSDQSALGIQSGR